ncbi:unnamed protein product [Meganyctiphanes norvegica]|uniref:Alpha-macroglobulin receptor-binding domain-containing protein n=1 Tax=Meganyctiphanes norvegica TaxID=48144 RepID=A0AAV2SK65_MEGNR
MEAGYKRELQYQHGNGSYSAFGKSDPSGSTWLTAFVLKSFAQARPFITVNEKDLIASKDWLESLQKVDGCFELVGRVIHKDMKGGLGGSDSDHLGPLTSYVLISLLEANLNTSVDTVDMAISCITNASRTTFYTEALSAYALALSTDENATSVIMSSYLLVISEDESASNSVSTSVLVEAMSYVLLAMLTKPDDYVAEIANLVRIITKHSNGEGGFVSTQDTVVALQALAKYSELFKSSDDSSLEVDVTRGEENWNFNIDDSNQLLVQIESMDVKDMSAYNVSVTATGKGCALVSSILRYNIPTFGDVDAFSANITANAMDDCLVGISVCASYILPDGESNMAIMELDLTTGFTPEIEYLDILLSMKLIKRYEVDEGLVTLYFDSLSANPTCIKFKAVREVTVADAKAATLTLYDYYDPKLTISQNFLMEVGEGCSD